MDEQRSLPKTVTVQFSQALVEQMADKWSPPVQCRLECLADGTWTMLTRYASDDDRS